MFTLHVGAWLLSLGVDILLFMCRQFMQVFGYYLQMSTLYFLCVDTSCMCLVTVFRCRHFIFHVSTLHVGVWLLSSGVDTLFFICRHFIHVFGYCLHVLILYFLLVIARAHGHYAKKNLLNVNF